jgi:hypothetical protein
MAIDLRATVSCSLGRVISGSVSDSFIQGAGLITTTGDCVIDGIITPSVGQQVTFGYVKNGLARNIPRRLRVLSFFANPFTKQTTVSLGCKLTYLSSLREAIDWTAFNDPENADRTEAEQDIVTVPINAKSIAKQCLDALGLQHDPIPLTNKFSISTFDFGSGYVNILNDLLVSESYFGYLDQGEVFRIRALDSYDGPTPIFSEQNVVEVGSINSGELPGEAVTVSYNTLVLGKKEVAADQGGANPYNWDYDIVLSPEKTIVWGQGDAGFDEDEGVTSRYYYAPPVFSYVPKTETITLYDKWDRVKQRRTVEHSILAETAPDYIKGKTAFLLDPYYKRLQMQRIGSVLSRKVTVTNYEYKYRDVGQKPEDYDTIKREITKTYQPICATVQQSEPGLLYSQFFLYNNFRYETVKSSFKFKWRGKKKTYKIKYKTPVWSQPRDLTQNEISEKTVITYEDSGVFGVNVRRKALRDFVRSASFNEIVTDRRFVSKIITEEYKIPTLARSVSFSPTVYELWEEKDMEVENVSVRMISGRSAFAETRPDSASRANANNLGFTVESSSGLELALGSAQAQRITEFSMPYAPDDVFIKQGNTYVSRKSDAAQKAKKFGTIQNKMLLGNRNGMNIQTIPEVIPNQPFSSVIIRANGTSALYRTNGLSWTFSNTGVVASIDALYWGVIGRSS